MVFGMNGVIKYLADEFLGIMREKKVDKKEYVSCLNFMVNCLGNAIFEELIKRKQISMDESKSEYYA